MSGNVSIRFSRKVTIVSFILSIGVMYIHAKNLAYYDFGDAIVCTNSFCALKFIDETYLRTAEDDGGY